MKKLRILGLVISMSFIVGCGGGGGGSSEPEIPPVNVLGTWNYSTATTGSICDGLVAQGINIIESNAGDNSQIGLITTEGTQFAIDRFGNCYLAPISSVDSSQVGKPSTMTKEQYVDYVQQSFAGIGTVQSFEVLNFHQSIISVILNLVNGVKIYSDQTRQ